MQVTILTESELRKCVDVNLEAIDAIEAAFSRLAAGGVQMPPILRLEVPEHNGEMDVKTAYVPGLDSFALKVSPGFFDNPKIGLPSLNGLMILLSARTGILEAMLLDNGYLTAVRTGAAGAVAARHLARESIQTAGVIGAGAQARYQMRALRKVRGFQRLLIYDVLPQSVETCIEEMTPEFGIEIIAASPEEVVRQSDIVVTTTPAREAIVRAEWLHPGLHITAMGSDGEGKQELDPEVLARADMVVCDRKSQAFRLGELQHAGQRLSEDDVIELGDITLGQKTGRSSDEQITVCDLTGTGVQDTAIATLAYQKARERGYGTLFET